MLENRPKKSLGQHFLTDKNIARKITSCLSGISSEKIIEVGPGRGILTEFLYKKFNKKLHLVEFDNNLVKYLTKNFPEISNQIISFDFLKLNEKSFIPSTSIIGNFPYNISSQILFKVLDNRQYIPEVVCMIQKEVAERITANHGNKTYGILSVLLQTYYKIEYLFTVNENVFNPPPKVKSAVIKLKRKENFTINCNEKLLFQIVKLTFNQRRKTIRNSISSIIDKKRCTDRIFSKRPEQLSVDEFIYLTMLISMLRDN